MYLNSPGGEVNSGFAIYDTMRFIKSEVRVVCTGLNSFNSDDYASWCTLKNIDILWLIHVF